MSIQPIRTPARAVPPLILDTLREIEQAKDLIIMKMRPRNFFEGFGPNAWMGWGK
jgi:hypothetical protein